MTVVDVGSLIASANLAVAAFIAFVAGVVSFASPCVVPLVPGYLPYMTGLSGAEIRAGSGGGGGRVLAGGLLFTLGCAVLFTLLGLVGGAVSATLSQRPWQIAMGVFVTALGLAMTGLLPFDILRREARITDEAIDRGVLRALPLGFVFGVGWTSCIGPALAAIFTLSASQSGASPMRGGLPALIYALDLGLPLIIFGLLYGSAGRSLWFLRRNAVQIKVGGGVMVSLVGPAIATGLYERFILWLRPMINGFAPPI